MTPLKGIRVLDLSKVLAGPLCAQSLGELGAEVIKVEPVGTGDDTRSWLPQDHGQSATFLAVNHNKRSLALDLKTAEGQAIVHALAAKADVILQGFGSGTATKLKVDYETLSKLNPLLIYCEISGYGRTGPLGGQPGYDVMLQGFSGMISTMGDPDGNFARASFSPVDIGTGMNALSGVLAAIIERGRTGKGLYLEVALLDTAVGFMTYLAQNYWRTGIGPKRMGTGHPALAPYQAFDASDGPLMIGVGNDGQWRRFCELTDLQRYIDDPDFATNASRVGNFSRTVALVQGKIVLNTRQYWLELLRKAGIPCSPINSLPEALDHPQVKERELIVSTEHPVLGALQNVGLPVRFNGEKREAQCPPPLLGQHTGEIMHALGYSEEIVADFAKRGVIGLAT